MQEVSVVGWRKFDELDHPDNFRAWACGIARYEVLMYRRKVARDRFVLSDELDQLVAEEGIEELGLRQQQLEALEGCLEKLPEERFLRVHRSYIIAVGKIENLEQNSLKIGKHLIPVSESNKKNLMDRLNVL